MKVRKKNLCHTCRKRKLQCDGKLPACSQCLYSKRDCEGYPEALFVPFVTTKFAGKAGQSRKTPALRPSQSRPACISSPCDPESPVKFKNAPNLPQRIARTYDGSSSIPRSYPVGLANTQERVSVVLRNYVPTNETGFETATSLVRSPLVCGSWVIALPELTIHTTGPFAECLHSALGALALSITAYRTSKDMLYLISTQYEHSLQLLAHNLAVTGKVYRNELVAAAMCLALVEVLSPIRSSSWLVHVEGVSKMIQHSSPDLFASGIEHTLFIGFRPLLILKACILRKATFFADDSWVRVPFQHHRAAPLQSLLGVAARIPGILEKVDVSIHSPYDTTIAVAQKQITELMEITAHLEVWHCSYLKSTSMPLYWRRTVESDNESNFELLWFQDLSTANVFTYFWAFQLIGLTNIQSLLERYPQLQQSTYSATYDAKGVRQACLELSIQIYQSMEYVLQKDFMLYGVSSADFPLQTACRTLELDSEGRAILKTLDYTIIARCKIQDI